MSSVSLTTLFRRKVILSILEGIALNTKMLSILQDHSHKLSCCKILTYNELVKISLISTNHLHIRHLKKKIQYFTF